MRAAVSVLLAVLLASAASLAPAHAATCERLEHEGNRYVVCEVAPARETLRLFLADSDGTPFGHFAEIETMLRADGKRLVFAMNAGMYHPDRSPVGHYIEDGQEQMRVVPNAGPGNFGLLPNGVLCIRKARADVFETRDYLEARPECRHATQSGPMLVIDGALHPRFLEDSSSRYIRNGVGTSRDGRRAVFAISESAVTFHAFGRLFRDALDVPNALFLDGNVSRVYAPQIGRMDLGRRMGPVVAVTDEAD